MKRSTHLLTLFWILAACGPVAHAQWPTTLRDNLPVAANPALMERTPTALPYPDGGTLVVYWQENLGNSYQIVNRYGQLVYAQPQPLVVGPAEPEFSPIAVADGNGGAFCAWIRTTNGPNPGYYTQRLDSLGNRLWGEAGVRLTTWVSPTPADLDISLDGQGGFFLAAGYAFPTNGIWVQHLNGQGQPLWGEEGIIVIPATPWGEGYPEIAPDGLGGLYMLWGDGRPPYYGALFMNRFDSSGNRMWGQGIFIYETGGSSLYFELLADGVGGAIAHYGGGNFNTAKRVDPNGNILWERLYVSWWQDAQMVLSGTGFVYLGFYYTGGIYAQKMDIRGRTYWPTLGSLHGALMMAAPPNCGPGNPDFDYLFPHFYGVETFVHMPQYSPTWLNVQVMDSLGHRMLGREGATLTYTLSSQSAPGMQEKNVVPDGEGGVVVVWEQTDGGAIRDIYAKHCNADGRLGGPIYTPTGVKSPAPPGRSVENLSVRADAISYALAQAAAVRLELFDILGRRVAVLQDEYQTAGTHTVGWDRKDLPSGIYLLRLSTRDDHQIVKIAIVQ